MYDTFKEKMIALNHLNLVQIEVVLEDWFLECLYLKNLFWEC